MGASLAPVLANMIMTEQYQQNIETSDKIRKTKILYEIRR